MVGLLNDNLQRYYGLGDKQIQYQIIDRTSFRQFLGIHTVDEIPDEKTVWNVKNTLSKAGTFDALFDKFRSYLDSKGRSLSPLWGNCVLSSKNQVK